MARVIQPKKNSPKKDHHRPASSEFKDEGRNLDKGAGVG
jgi:hypothetical protein